MREVIILSMKWLRMTIRGTMPEVKFRHLLQKEMILFSRLIRLETQCKMKELIRMDLIPRTMR